MSEVELMPTEATSCVCTALRKASRRLSQMYDAALVPTGLKTTQYSILVEIERHLDAPLTMRELADAMVMDRSTLGHNLRPLERDQLVALEAGAEDRRRKHVVLTRQGQARLLEARKLWRKAHRRFETVFGVGEADTLRKTLLAVAGDERLSADDISA
jgi:DNA-binding MarR family transcriptional regulator